MHPLSIRTTGLPPVADSGPVGLRRPRLTVYRCSLPGLTGFTASRRAGPGHQRHLPGAVPTAPGPRAGIRSRYSGLRVQGTASSPSSTTEGHPTTACLARVKPPMLPIPTLYDGVDDANRTGDRHRPAVSGPLCPSLTRFASWLPVQRAEHVDKSFSGAARRFQRQPCWPNPRALDYLLAMPERSASPYFGSP